MATERAETSAKLAASLRGQRQLEVAPKSRTGAPSGLQDGFITAPETVRKMRFDLHHNKMQTVAPNEALGPISPCTRL